MNLIDLCDYVLMKIFSYLNLEDGIRLPLVCKRFRCFVQQNNLPISNTSSMELQTLKSSSKRNLNYNRVFEKLGSHLKKFTIDSNEDAFEMNLIMKSIAKYCRNIKMMDVRLLYANTVKSLPKSLHNLKVGDFRGKCLNISNLTHLEKLDLVSSRALDDVQVYRPLKELRLVLHLGHHMPDFVKINRLTKQISEKLTVELFSDFSDQGYFYPFVTETIEVNDLNRVMNLKIFTVHLLLAIRVKGINPTNIHSSKMLCNCGHFVPLSMDTVLRFLGNFIGPNFTRATKVIRYIPRTDLTIEFKFDDYEDRYKYFKGLNLNFPICHCKSVAARVLLV